MNNQVRSLSQQLKWVGWILVIMLMIEIVNLLSGRMLSAFGILPRNFSSLGFIFTAPFLHGSLGHFASNMLTLAVFVICMLQFGNKRFVQVSILLVIMTGILVWLFGRAAIHIGASGVIYGYFGYLLLAGILSGRLFLAAISVLIGIFYGTMIFGVLPSYPYVSWESHLFGFVSGLMLAYAMRKPSAK
jgi:membrane associated rhomboid family serine protease